MNKILPATQKNPNPQGKGSVAVLQDWAATRPSLVGHKPPAQILRDYLLSALVLAAKFRFRPVPGKRYYLYCDSQQWILSMIGPAEWVNHRPGEFVGSCCLQSDATWKVDFGELRQDGAPMRRLAQFVDGFTSELSSRQSLLDDLPFFERQLPYYQRMLATGLASSLQRSITDTGAEAVAQALPSLTPMRLRFAHE